MKKQVVSMMTACMLMFLFSLAVVSCSDDEKEDPSSQEANLIGTWVLVHDEGYEMYKGKKDEYDNTYTVSEKAWTREFHADGTFSAYDEEIKDEGTWKKDGNTLIITTAGDEEKEKILTLDASRLVVESGTSDWYDKSTYQKIK